MDFEAQAGHGYRPNQRPLEVALPHRNLAVFKVWTRLYRTGTPRGRDGVELAGRDALPALVTVKALRGELHAHSTSSDGANSIQEMAAAA